MKNTKFQLNVGFGMILSLCAAAASAQQLWDRTRDGMSLQTVRRMFPTAENNPKPVKLYDGALSLLQMQEARLGGHIYVAHFFFAQEQLVHVRLMSQGPIAQQKPAHTAASTELRKRYGTTIDSAYSNANGVISGKDTWKKNKTKIDLHFDCVALPGADNCLVLAEFRSRKLPGGLWAK